VDGAVASVRLASLLLTTEAIICEIPEGKGEKGSAGMSPGGDTY